MRIGRGGAGARSATVSADGLTYSAGGFKANTPATLLDTRDGTVLATGTTGDTGAVSFTLATKPPIGARPEIEALARASGGIVAAPVTPAWPAILLESGEPLLLEDGSPLLLEAA